MSEDIKTYKGLKIPAPDNEPHGLKYTLNSVTEGFHEICGVVRKNCSDIGCGDCLFDYSNNEAALQAIEEEVINIIDYTGRFD